MSKRLRKILMLIFAVVFAIGVTQIGYGIWQYRQGKNTYEQAKELIDLPDLQAGPSNASSGQGSAEEETPPEEVYVDPYADALRNMDFTALRQVNQEVLGWILVPDTVISYPLLQHSDNQYYLNRTWRNTRNSVGSIFLECRNSGDMGDFNTVIYGHNVNDGSMFGGLKKYKQMSYWAAHPNIYIITAGGSRCYQVFAAYEVSTTGTTYQLGFSDEGEKSAFLDFCLSQSVIDTGVIPGTQDHILTLSTCTGHGHATRWVVQAVMKNTAATEDMVDDGAVEPTEEPANDPISKETQQPEEFPPEEIPADDPGAEVEEPAEESADGGGDVPMEEHSAEPEEQPVP